MQLTAQQLQAIETGEAVAVALDDQQCVVVRQDVYEQLLAKNGGGLPPDAVGALVNEAMAEYDADDPLLASYQKVD